MKSVKVTFSNKDKILAGIVRAIAVEVAGFQVVGGLTQKVLIEKGFYLFMFANEIKSSDFIEALKKYLPKELYDTIKIEEFSN